MAAIATLKNAVNVALRKESVDRNQRYQDQEQHRDRVALRKESVDRNDSNLPNQKPSFCVALRKESVDRNIETPEETGLSEWSLSARRAWIEMLTKKRPGGCCAVALRKESVDRNNPIQYISKAFWVALRKESVDRNYSHGLCDIL